jgi:8-oxo-dGTP diphosphatase
MSIVEQQRPRVGVSVFLYDDLGRFLIGLRKGSLGAGTWALPGGHLEFRETVVQAGCREPLEETGLEVDELTIRHAGYSESYFEAEEKHYVTLLLAARAKTYEPRIMEPEKCAEWRWVTPQTLPSPLFSPLQNYLERNTIPRPR